MARQSRCTFAHRLSDKLNNFCSQRTKFYGVSNIPALQLTNHVVWCHSFEAKDGRGWRLDYGAFCQLVVDEYICLAWAYKTVILALCKTKNQHLVIIIITTGEIASQALCEEILIQTYTICNW